MRQCVAQTKSGRRHRWWGRLIPQPNGDLVCPHHDRHGYVPWTVEDEPDPMVAERARAVMED